MSSFSDRYEYWVTEAERWDAVKKTREAEIKKAVLGERNRVQTLGGRDTSKLRVDAATVIDHEVKDAEKMRQRAVDRATMYGFGMLLEQLRIR